MKATFRRRIGACPALLAILVAARSFAEDADEQSEPPPLPSATSPAPSPAPSMFRIAVPMKDGMLRLPGGRFTMGSRDPKAPVNERPAHAAVVAPFWLDRTEVTVGAYAVCVAKHMCARPARASLRCTYDAGDAELPVSCVHWSDADAYCRFVGKRLPREAEWEFAARGPFALKYPWGRGVSCRNAVTLLRDLTSRSCTLKHPARVGSHPLGASIYGALDMSGNVEEWCSDWYVGSVAEGAAPSAGASHVLRGGGWLSGPSFATTTSRNWGSSLEAGPNVGFRCAQDAGPHPPAGG